MDESLVSFIEDVCGDSHLRVEDDLGDGFVRLRSTEAERRQAKQDIRSNEDIVIEMLRNARDAGARNIFLALSRDGQKRRINMIDDGAGIPTELQELIFSPRVTSKLDSMHLDKWGVHGRGMALYSIRENALEARVVHSVSQMGSSFLIETDLRSLTERSDQSTLPSFVLNEEGNYDVRGPHNIQRAVAEFAYDCKDSCTVYLGSPSDIVATLYLFGEATLSKTERTFCTDIDTLPLVKRFATASDSMELQALAQSLGLIISERTARRILDNEIKAISEILETVSFECPSSEKEALSRKGSSLKRLSKDPRGLKVHAKDLEEFESQISSAYRTLAKKYYLEGDGNPQIRISKNAIDIRIDFSKVR